MKKWILMITISQFLTLSAFANSNHIATQEEIDKAIKHPDCGYFIKVAIDKGFYVFKYGFGGGKEIKAPYKKVDIDNMIWQCEIYKDQRISGKTRRDERFLPDNY